MKRVECSGGHKWYPEVNNFHLCPVCGKPPVEPPHKANEGYVCPEHGERVVLIADGYRRGGYYYPCCGEKVKFSSY